MVKWDDFVKIIERDFDYLVKEFGFKKVSNEIPFVIFESKYVRISFFWEYGGRYEFDIGFEPILDDEKQYYSLGISDLHKRSNTEYLLIDSKEKIEQSSKEMASVLAKYGQKILTGDKAKITKIFKKYEKLTEV